MQAVILAAGEARRLRPLTDNKPKCLLEVADGTTVLDATVRNLLWAGADELVLVTGFCAQQIRAHMAKHYPGLQVRWVHNERFATTNNAYSLWLAREAVRGPFLLLDADILFDRRILAMLLGLRHHDALAVRTAGHWSEEDMKVVLDPQGLVQTISKKVRVESASGESIGIEKFSAQFARALFAELGRRMDGGRGAQEFYEASFQAVIEASMRLYGLDISPLACVEIDTLEDYRHAREVAAGLCSVE
ncbi:MAG: phosphocholine cytidylyltransferase family protein [bacterium]|jgi:choline kinase|nr:phosphocholine cytidylyltransferase family protein [candidate division KSB1 bacterium]MDH7558914.1 phosphocholine cytidylyltransferase family protein [bacterium]